MLNADNKCGQEKAHSCFYKGRDSSDWHTRRCRDSIEEGKGNPDSPMSLPERVCKECGVSYTPTGSRQVWCPPCGETIKKAKHAQRCRERHQRTYKNKGYNQSGQNNNNYKGGIGTYNRDKLENTANQVCERCGSDKFMVVHHKDRDRYNNGLSNLELLCKSCHQNEHMNRDPATGKFMGC